MQKKSIFAMMRALRFQLQQQNKIILMAQELIQLLRINKIQVKIGYQRDLYKIYQRYGPFSKEFFRQLQVYSSSNFRQIVRNLANNLPQSQISYVDEEINSIIKDFSNYLLQTRYLKVQDVKKLINDVLNGIESQQIIALYGLMDEFSKDFIYFEQQIKDKTTNLLEGEKLNLINEIGSKIKDKIISSATQRILNLNEQRVSSPQAFKVICLKNRIFIKESFLREFFNFLQIQGPLSQNLQPLIKKLTYPFFYQKLTEIVSILFRQEKLQQNSQLKGSSISISSMLITHLSPAERPSFHQSNLYIQIQDFESDGFSIPSRLNMQSHSQQNIQQPNRQSYMLSQTRLNPFRQQQNMINQNQKNINVILIYLTIVPCKNIQIKENDRKEIWTNMDFIQKNYKKTVQIYYMNQNLKRDTQYTVRINERNILVESANLKIHKGCALMIEVSDDPRLKRQSINLPQMFNYSLFLGMKFLAKNVVYNQQQDIAIHFLKLFYDNYSFQVPEQISAALLHNIYISKTVPFFHTKYLMYFFYQTFKRNALRYFFEHQIFKNLKYKDSYEFKPPKDISVLETAEHFYNLTQLINFMKMQPKQIQKIKNLAQKNLQNQKRQNTYIILYIIICEAPIQVVLLLQAQIKLKCFQNTFITQSEYYNLMTKFITRVLENQSEYEQKRNAITKYLKDLYSFCERKKIFNSNRQLQIDSKIFDAFVNKSRSKNERINFSTLLKKIYKITEGELDPTIKLKDTGNFQPEAEEARYMLCLAKKPFTNFDKLEIDRLIRTRLWSQHLQSFVNILASQCNLANYEIQRITHIVRSILSKCGMISAQRVDEIVLGWLQVCNLASQKGEYTQQDILFLNKVFKTLLSTVYFMLSINPPTIMIIRERKRIQNYLESAIFDSFKKEILLRLNRQLIQKQCSVESIIEHIYRYNHQNRNLTYQRELKQLWAGITGRLNQ